MEDHNKKEDNQPEVRKEELLEEEEFGHKAFEEEEQEEKGTESAGEQAAENETEPAEEQAAAPAPAAARSSKLPWFLFAASVVAIGALLLTGQTGMKGNAATVNGQKVTKEELYKAMYSQSGEAALDNLITEKLVNQEADKKKIQVTDQDVDNELKTIKSQFPDDTQYKDALTKNNMTEDLLKENITTHLKISKIFEGQMDLSEAKQKEYFEKNKDKYGTPEQIEVSHILVTKKEDADKLLEQLKAGADFAQLAKDNSTDTATKDKGGSLGFVSRNQGLDKAFEDAAFKLNKGEMSGVVQSSFGYHIIKVTDKKAAVAANYDEQKDKVKKDMISEEVEAKASDWLQKLKTDAKIEKTKV